MNRDHMLEKLAQRREPWDMVIIGGGATGAGIAVDAASRGYEVLLIEQSDFGKGTSSRSTKLVHGGVRYLEQGNISLVMEALKERGLLRENAPHLVHDLAFIVPNYDWWEAPFYGMGLKVYDLLAGKFGFGPSRLLSRPEILEAIPTLKTDGLRGGVIYYDGQFDDSRLLINLIATAAEYGGILINYVKATGLLKDNDGFINGVVAEDLESGESYKIGAKVVINATGAFTDAVRHMADPSLPSMIAPSQGIHLVFERSIMPGNSAIMVPRTSDGRVMFAIPWHKHVIVGTTDTAIEEALLDPVPLDHEIEFILETAAEYLSKAPKREDVLSVFVGIRPLVKSSAESTAAMSRDHVIHIDGSGLLTICGGKWTTYRKMAEDCVDHAITLARLPDRPCQTKSLRIHGYHKSPETLGELAVYGADALEIEEIRHARKQLSERLHDSLPYTGAEVVFAARAEMARTVDDFLSRRVRALFLNAGAAIAMAPAVAQIMAAELKKDDAWVQNQIDSFASIAAKYMLASTAIRK